MRNLFQVSQDISALTVNDEMTGFSQGICSRNDIQLTIPNSQSQPKKNPKMRILYLKPASVTIDTKRGMITIWILVWFVRSWRKLSVLSESL